MKFPTHCRIPVLTHIMTALSSLTILQSPLLNLTTVQRTLDRCTDPNEGINLLSAKIHILSHPTGASSSSSTQQTSSSTTSGPSSTSTAENDVRLRIEELERAVALLQARLELTQALMGVLPARTIEAEAELTSIEGECKRRAKRWTKHRRLSSSVAGPSINTRAADLTAEATRAAGATVDIKVEPKALAGTEMKVDRVDEDEAAGNSRTGPLGGLMIPIVSDEETHLRSQVMDLRIMALKELVRVEVALRRNGRAKRWTELIRDLDREPGAPG